MPRREAEHWVFLTGLSINPHKKPSGAEQCSPRLRNESLRHRATEMVSVHLTTNPKATVQFSTYLQSTYYVPYVAHREAPGKAVEPLQEDVAK